MSDFLEAVSAAFRRLIDRGFLVIVSDQYDEKAFGNAVVVLAGGNVRIRLVRDRGDIFADAASVNFPDEWAPLERVLVAVGVPAVRPEGLLMPADSANLVEKHFTMLDAGLGGDQLDETKTRLAEIKRFKTAEAMRRLKGGKD